MVAPSWAFHRLSSFTLQITWADSVHRKDDPGQIIFVSLVFTGSEIPCAMGCQSSTGQTDTTGGHRKAQSLSCFVHNSSWYSLCLFWLRQNIFLMFPLNDNDSWWVFFSYFSPCFCICVAMAVFLPWILVLLISRFGEKMPGNHWEQRVHQHPSFAITRFRTKVKHKSIFIHIISFINLV